MSPEPPESPKPSRLSCEEALKRAHEAGLISKPFLETRPHPNFPNGLIGMRPVHILKCVEKDALNSLFLRHQEALRTGKELGVWSFTHGIPIVAMEFANTKVGGEPKEGDLLLLASRDGRVFAIAQGKHMVGRLLPPKPRWLSEKPMVIEASKASEGDRVYAEDPSLLFESMEDLLHYKNTGQLRRGEKK